ncbi:hypothetical protein ABZT04_04250 [Streptomyces sp. NPDC005492]|uniref:hypothetical protein n=1 Tax=Streptomyces sp. NPDC005492 TaxID=3156883 RepID=UPI0033A10361
MLDVIAIIDGSRGKPVSDWLPEVVWHLRQAGMDYGGFLAVAARQEPKDLMETVAAFNDHFKGEGDPWGGASSTNDETRHLLAIAARIKEPEKTPIFVVGLRRAGMDEYVESFLSGVARNKPVRSLRAAVQVLKSASLRGDATRLLKIIGRERGVKDAAHTIRHFWGNGSSDDAVVILQGVGEGESARLVQIYQEVSSMSLGGMRTLDEIVRGVPEFLRDNKASELEALGHSDIAEKLRAIGDSNPPF